MATQSLSQCAPYKLRLNTMLARIGISMKIMILVLFILSLCSCATIQKDSASGAVKEYGIFSMGEIVDVTSFTETNTGVLTTHGDYRIHSLTDRIPAVLGVTFGYCYEISVPNKKSIVLTRVVRHPPMKKPDQSISTGYSYDKEFVVTDGIVSYCTTYTFEHEWEVVIGYWHFEIAVGGKKVVGQRFTLFEH